MSPWFTEQSERKPLDELTPHIAKQCVGVQLSVKTEKTCDLQVMKAILQ